MSSNKVHFASKHKYSYSTDPPRWIQDCCMSICPYTWTNRKCERRDRNKSCSLKVVFLFCWLHNFHSEICIKCLTLPKMSLYLGLRVAIRRKHILFNPQMTHLSLRHIMSRIPTTIICECESNVSGESSPLL